MGEERDLVQKVIEKHLKVKLDMEEVYEKYFEVFFFFYFHSF